MRKKAALFYDYPTLDGEVFSAEQRARIGLHTDLYPHVVHAGNFSAHAPALGDVEVIFATWGMMSFDDTKGILRYEHFASMRDGATFINSGRGAQVVEEDLIAVLRERPDLTALLDVTWPEPPASDSPLWTLANVVISPHVGGSIGDEVTRLAQLAIDEFEAWLAGRPLTHEVTREILTTMG